MKSMQSFQWKGTKKPFPFRKLFWDGRCWTPFKNNDHLTVVEGSLGGHVYLFLPYGGFKICHDSRSHHGHSAKWYSASSLLYS